MTERLDGGARSGIERDLVFALLCLDEGGIDRENVARSLDSWAADPSRPLIQCLHDGLLSERQAAAIDTRVEAAVNQYAGDTSSTLRSLVRAEGGVPPLLAGLLETALAGGLRGNAGGGVDQTGAVIEAEDRYEEKGEHGRGGLGRVLLVRDHFLGRDVALKELLTDRAAHDAPTLDADAAVPDGAALLRFLQEARVTSQLEHPGIVPVYELGLRADGRPYYTMKLVRGQTLDQAIASAPALAERLRLLPHFIDVCQAVAFAHSRGVLHRDIKPQNIMVGAFGETVLLDWGLAKLRNGEGAESAAKSAEAGEANVGTMTLAGELLGTPAYMAPEQARGDSSAVAECTDVYALGAVLYTLLSGHKPFSGTNAEDVVAQVLRHSPEPVERRVDHLPSELAAICNKAMAKEPAQRYPSATELAEEVQRFQTGAMVQAYTYGRRERIMRFARRHRAVLSVATVALALLVAGGAVAIMRILEETSRTRYELYAASINIAQGALERGLNPEPQEALASAPIAYRGWEWGHLAYLARPEVLTLHGHSAMLRHGIFSANGDLILTGAWDTTAKLWDSHTGTLIRTFTGLTMPARRPSLSADASRAAAASSDGAVIVWDVATGASLFQVNQGEPFHASVLSPDGRRLVTWGGAPTFRLWDVDTGKLLGVFKGHTGPVGQVVWSADGRVLASGGHDHTARLWNAETFEALGIFTGHTGWIMSTALSEDASLLATCATDGTARLYDTVTGESRHVFAGHTALYVNFVEFTRDGRHVVTASEDRTVRVWDVATGNEVRCVTGLFKAEQLLSVHPDGSRFLTAGPDYTALVRTFAPEDSWRVMRGHTGPVNEVAFSPDGTLIGTAAGHWAQGGDDRAIIWDAETGQQRMTLRGHQGPVTSLAFLPDNTQVLTVGNDATMRLWDLRDGREAGSWQEHTDQVRCVVVNSDGTRALTGSWDKTARIWDLQEVRVTAVLDHPDLVDSVAFSPQGDTAATTCRDNTARLWNAATGALLREYPCQRGWVFGVAFSNDGQRLAVGNDDGTALILHVGTGEVLHELLGHTKRVQTLVFSRDGRRLVTGGVDKQIKVWDTGTGRDLLTISVHADRVQCLALSPDGLTLASAGDDGIAVLMPALPWRAEDCPGPIAESFERRLQRYHAEYWTRKFPKLAAAGVFTP